MTATLVVKRTFLEYATLGPQLMRRSLSAPSLAIHLDAGHDHDEAHLHVDSACKMQEVLETMSDLSTGASEETENWSEGDVVAGWPDVFPHQLDTFDYFADEWAAPPTENGSEKRTTVMLRNLPNDYSREMVIALINHEGFAGRYDFLYLPIDFTSGVARGFAFVNLLTPDDVQRFIDVFSGFCRWDLPSKKVAEVAWSRLQGLEMNLEEYRNSSVMHNAVPDEFKPVMFENGHRIDFPTPAKTIPFPNGLVWPHHAGSGMSCVGFTETLGELPAERTTLMIRNLPIDLTRCMLLNLLSQQGFDGCYDFVYLPMDFRTGGGKGFAFVNMVSPHIAGLLRSHFTGFSSWPLPSRKVAEVVWSSPNQGLAIHIERYRNSAVMHESVPDHFKPMLFQDGVRVDFPAPTRVIRAP